ncbi:DUF1062 domain-containing protein [Micromonospora sp. NPDC004540]|uniref:DUF1062 domain-containing protein n=1 Tax=Micromonospora sp. NPDC004540 TaxID=3154457 RepID=UPI0033BFAE35
MSTRPHIVLPWTLRRTRLPLLLVACVSCGRTSTITVHDRVPVRYLDPILLAGYSSNSSALAARLLLDTLIVRRNRVALEWDSCWPERLITQRAGHRPRGDRSLRQDRHPAEPQHSPGLLVGPARSRRRGPEPGREARWPCPGLQHAAVRARSLLTGHDRRSGPARYGRRR